MPVKIVTDSTSDLNPQIAAPLGITVVPLYIHFGTESYLDGVSLTTEEFYRKLASSKTLPTTAVPSPASFARVYDEVARETDEIVVISLASKLSSCYAMESQAIGMMKRKCRIELIDSKAGCMALGLIAIAAAKAANAGAKIDEVLDITRRNIHRSKIYFAFDTLEYLKRGGRVNAAQAFLGSVLNVNPIMTLEEGEGKPVGRPRSRVKAIEFLYKFAVSFSNIEEMAIEDATTPDEADTLAERISSKYPKERIYRTKVSPVVGTHVGPHVLAVSVLGDIR
jgi:DegV family protein with EDD domain